MFSLYLIIAVLREVYMKIHPKKEFKYPSDRDIKDTIYNFKYCGLSREAIIVYVETFAKSYKIGLDVLDIIEKEDADETI